MPVVINNQTNLAENLPDQQAQQALNAGTHAYPVVGPDGSMGAANANEINGRLQEGYQQPNPSQLQDLLDYAKYSGTGEQVKTYLEGVGEGLVGPLSTGAELMAGVNPAAIRGRKDVNPGLKASGQLTGFAGSALTGVGEAELVGQAGQAAAEAAGLSGAKSLIAKAGSSAIKQATEMALLSSGDEVSKAMVGDPEASMANAINHIGLSALIGGGVGGVGTLAVSPLWEATKGSKLAQLMGMVSDKSQVQAQMDVVNNIADSSGLPIPPELRAVIGGGAEARAQAEALNEAGTSSGSKFQESVNTLRKNASDSMVSALGRSPEQLEDVSNLSEYDMGTRIRDSLVNELQATSKPISDMFEPIQKKFSATPLPDSFQGDISEKLAQLSASEGYGLSETGVAKKELDRVLQDVPNLKTLEDLRKYQSVARQNIGAAGDWRLARQVGNVFREAEDKALNDKLLAEAPALSEQLSNARSGYKSLMGTIDDLNERLHVGSYHGPSSFLSSLKEMTPEAVLRRLKGSSDVELLNMLNEKFPQAAQAVKDYHIDTALKTASRYTEEGVNGRKLAQALERWSPELRQFALPAGSQESIGASKDILDKLNFQGNPSHTAGMMDKLNKHMLGGIGSVIGLFSGAGPAAGWIGGQTARWVGREAPDAAKLAWLKFLGRASESGVDASAFKAAHTIAESAYKGTRLLQKAAGAVFKGGEVIPMHLLPSDKAITAIKKAVETAQIDPMRNARGVDKLVPYMPEHAAAASASVGRATTYLNSLRPANEPKGPLDIPTEPSKAEEGRYERAIETAQQPLMILKHLKEGSLTSNDIRDIQALHPAALANMRQEVMNSLLEHKAKDGTVPYSQALNLSLFLGQPLESSIRPLAIMGNQMAITPLPSPQQGQGRALKSKAEPFKKSISMEQTQSQQAESRRLKP